MIEICDDGEDQEINFRKVIDTCSDESRSTVLMNLENESLSENFEYETECSASGKVESDNNPDIIDQITTDPSNSDLLNVLQSNYYELKDLRSVLSSHMCITENKFNRISDEIVSMKKKTKQKNNVL